MTGLACKKCEDGHFDITNSMIIFTTICPCRCHINDSSSTVEDIYSYARPFFNPTKVIT